MNCNILAVDDEQAIRELIKDLLELRGYRVVTACDGEDALLKMEEETFDLFIIDMSMPKMDGMALLKEIKRIQPLAVVIVLTGFSCIEGVVNAVHAGAYQYISKPIKSKALFELVEKALDYSHELYGPLHKSLNQSGHAFNPTCPMILNGFTSEEKEEFYGLGKVESYKSGETITCSESIDGSIIIIESGEISVWSNDCNFDYLKKFDSWGEESFILEDSMPVNLRAESDLTIRLFERKRILDFFSFKGEDLLKRFVINISGSLSLKWRKSIQRIVMLRLVAHE